MQHFLNYLPLVTAHLLLGAQKRGGLLVQIIVLCGGQLRRRSMALSANCSGRVVVQKVQNRASVEIYIKL
jgi:hypothetical protein